MITIKFMMMAPCREDFNYSCNLLFKKKSKANHLKCYDLIEVDSEQTSVHYVIFSHFVHLYRIL